MSAALLRKAILDTRERVNDALYKCEDADIPANGLREARELLGVLANVVNGMELRSAFGAPGDWGYENALGQGVLQLLSGDTRS